MLVVPIAHDFVQAAAAHTARGTARLVDEVTEEHGIWRKRLIVDIAIQRLIHSEDELRHVGFAFLPAGDE